MAQCLSTACRRKYWKKLCKSNMMVTITVRIRALFYVKRDVREEERVRKLGHSPHMLFNTWHQGLTKVHNSYGKRGEEKKGENKGKRKKTNPPSTVLRQSFSRIVYRRSVKHLSQLWGFFLKPLKTLLCINDYLVNHSKDKSNHFWPNTSDL